MASMQAMIINLAPHENNTIYGKMYIHMHTALDSHYCCTDADMHTYMHMHMHIVFDFYILVFYDWCCADVTTGD